MTEFPMRLGRLCWLALPINALAQSEPAPAVVLAPVVVTATRSEARAFDVPAAVDRIDGEQMRDGRAQVNISESLGAIPGLLARDRQNHAQDVQISVRGFGARASFGIRGVRLYVDHIPATLPDGQGQISHVELGSVGRIEVLRGPFSALYGNAAGGVILVHTEDGVGPPRLGLSASVGSDGALRLGAQASGASQGLGFVVGVSRFNTDGYRDHSGAERHLGNLKLSLHPDADSKLTLIANRLQLPEAQDPLGLNRAAFEARPRSVDAAALNFNTRKTVRQAQGGLVYERRLDAANALQWTGYLGRRSTEQFQAIPVASQANPLHPGGVIDLGRDYSGTDLRWTLKSSVLGAPLTLVAGLAYDRLNEQRRGFLNFSGKTLGVVGDLRRDEVNRVSSSDQYLQASLQLAPRWGVNAGLRRSRVQFASNDRYSVGSNPDDSGSADYPASLPTVGVMFLLSDAVHLYASAGRGFETPTLNELAYRSGTAGGGGGGPNVGLNFSLQAARSDSVEAGAKARLAAWGELSAALFHTGTAHEIVTQTNVGGRATYQNAGSTRRRGLELAWTNRWAQHVQAQWALTGLDARYREGFSTCTTAPCTTPNQQIAAGKRMPGLARWAGFAALNWTPPLGWRAGVEARYLSSVPVNDLNSDAAPGYAVAAATLGYRLNAGPWELGGFVRADNLFNRAYAGSVIVNEGSGRFFEPAPGRIWLAGASASRPF